MPKDRACSLSRRTGRGRTRFDHHVISKQLVGESMTETTKLLAALLPLALAGGCTVGPDYHRPDVPVPAHFSTTQPSAPSAPVDLSRWWETFQDPTLDSLVGRAVQSNLDLRVAQARLLEARAQRQAQTTGLFPVANASASYVRDRFSKNGFYIPAGGAAALNSPSANRAATGAGGNTNNSSGLASAFN